MTRRMTAMQAMGTMMAIVLTEVGISVVTRTYIHAYIHAYMGQDLLTVITALSLETS